MNRLSLTTIFVRVAGIILAAQAIYKTLGLSTYGSGNSFDLALVFDTTFQTGHISMSQGGVAFFVHFWSELIIGILLIRFSYFFAKLLWLGIPITEKNETDSNNR